MAIVVGIEDPRQEDVRALIAELDALLFALTPPEHCYYMTPDEMARDGTTVFVTREDGHAVACGALKRHGDIGEVKRMCTKPQWQPRGLGGRTVGAIEELAMREGLSRLVLETGDRHNAAYRMYERAGFRRCGPVLSYPCTRWSVFYEKPLMREAA